MKYEISRGTIVYNGIKIKDYGVWAKGGGMYSAPARRYTSLTVPGRNGVLTIDEGAFEEVEHEYPCFIAEDFPVNIQGLRNALLASPGPLR
jgi:phage-related protein